MRYGVCFKGYSSGNMIYESTMHFRNHLGNIYCESIRLIKFWLYPLFLYGIITLVFFVGAGKKQLVKYIFCSSDLSC
jgi:hypothetical protein